MAATTRLLLSSALLLGACAPENQIIPAAPEVDPGDVADCGFTQVNGTDFWEYNCNPVFEVSGENWADSIRSTTFLVTEVLGHPFYQMWYSGVPATAPDSGGDFGLGYAVSSVGTEGTWENSPLNPLLTEPTSQRAWDWSAMDGMQVVWDPNTNQYVMVYQGYNISNPLDSTWGMGVATSPDGQAWTRLASNPVLDLTRPQAGLAGYCWPLGISLGVAAGYTGYVAGYKRADGPCEAFAIQAPNVNNWNPTSNSVLPAGRDGTWNDQGYVALSVAKLDTTWYMFYAGFGDWLNHPAEGYKEAQHLFLGMATSHDGSSWNADPNPIPINHTAEGQVSFVAANTVGTRIHLWVTDYYQALDTQAVGYYLYEPNAEGSTDE